MSKTAQNVIDEVQRFYTDLGKAKAFEYVQEVHEELLSRYSLRDDTVAFSAIVAGTASYDLPDTALRAESATYYGAAGSPAKLYAFSPDDWDNDPTRAGWRDQTGTPRAYGMEATAAGQQQIIFFPNPTISTAAGYPKVVMQVRRNQTLLTTDTLPFGGAFCFDAYVSGVAKRHAYIEHRERYGDEVAKETDAVHQFEDFLSNRLPEIPPSLLPNFLPRRRVV